MAAGTLPAPGTKYGPCLGGCEHRDCANTRRMAVEYCRICFKVINYDRAFYQESPAILVHADCAEREVEKERKQANA